MHKKIISVAIPACNEENNIKQLLISLLNQNQELFILKRIIVSSDGSTDSTVNQVKSINDNRVQIIVGKERIGKPKRLTEIFKLVDEEILVQFDADILINDKNILNKMVKPFMRDNSLSLVGGNARPLKPKNYIETLAYFGVMVWDEARTIVGEKSECFNFSGVIRAFSKDFIKEFKYPPNIGSSEDSFCFYYAKSKNKKTFYAKDAKVYFRLANTYQDYSKQMIRFLNTPIVLHNYFEEKLLRKYNSISTGVKIRALLRIARQTPLIYVISYLFLQNATKIKSKFYKELPAWDMSDSTKKI